MKRIVKTSFLLLALLSLVFSSCKKEYDRPEFDPLPIGEVLTIEKILDMESGTVFNEDASVYGIITADEKSGNLYKASFLQDRASGKAIELYLNATSGVRIGDSVRVYLKGVTYAMYNGLPQLSNFEPDGHIIILANDKPIQPAEATIADIIAGKYLGGLVKLKNVMFTDRGTFADPTGYGNRTLVDPTNLSQSVIVRTSNYANFANDSLPQGTGNVVAIASLYNQTWQLLIRSAKELEFENYNPNGEDGVMTLPYYQSFASNFGTYSTYDVTGSQSWTIDYSTAKMAGFENNTNYANEDWLISSPVSFAGTDGVSLTMTYIARYFSNLDSDITLQVSSDYQSGDPNEATWKQVPASWVSGSDWNTFAQTTVDLSEFAGQKVRVAVKYVSSNAKAGTIEVQSIAIQAGSGPTPPPGPNPGGEVQSLPYSQSFASDFGTYLTKDVLGAQSWEIDFSTAKMTGYVKPDYFANEDWLISSPVDLSGVNGAKMTMSYIGRYFTNINQEVTVWVASDYVWDSDPATANWVQVPATLSEGSDWNNFLTAEISLGQFVGGTVNVAVKYTSTNQKAGTIEIQSILIEESGDGPTPPPGPGGEVQSMPYSQDFETDFGTYITKDVLGAQSWMIDFKSAKMTGYSGAAYANEDWLISSPVKIEGVEHAKIVVNYAAKYSGPSDKDITIQVSSNYEFNAEPATANWVELPVKFDNNNKEWAFDDLEASLDNFLGQTVTVAIKYTSTTAGARTIEIKNITVKEGNAGDGPTPPPGPDVEVQSMPYSQSFETDFGTYITKDVEGAQSWMIDFKSAKMTGYSGAAYANEDWLISSPVQIVGVEHAKIVVNYAAKYSGPSDKDITIQVSSNYEYNDEPSTANWVELPASFPNNNKEWTFNDLEASLDNFLGQTVTVAIKYTSTTAAARTIEIKNITVQEGDTGDGPTPPPGPGDPEGSGTADDPYNVAAGIAHQNANNTQYPENTEVAWVQGFIVGSVKASHSTVTANGDVAWEAPFELATNVVIADDPGCREISQCLFVNLPAGKPLREIVNLVNTPDNLGKRLTVLGKLYNYFGQPGLRDSNGQEGDFVLEGYVPPTPPDPEGFFSESFMYGQGDFTIQNVVLPEGLSYVWAHNASYQCMKASSKVSGVSYATESWLVSPPIALPFWNIITLTFEQAVNFASHEGMLSVMVSTDYDGDVTRATWTELNLDSWPAGNNWDFSTSSTTGLTSYMEQTVVIGFKYTSTSSTNPAWEIKNLVVF